MRIISWIYPCGSETVTMVCRAGGSATGTHITGRSSMRVSRHTLGRLGLVFHIHAPVWLRHGNGGGGYS
jgi:hypothetical protein